jgi:hypothetical protein
MSSKTASNSDDDAAAAAREAAREKEEFEEWKWIMQRVRDGKGIPSGYDDPGNSFPIPNQCPKYHLFCCCNFCSNCSFRCRSIDRQKFRN